MTFQTKNLKLPDAEELVEDLRDGKLYVRLIQVDDAQLAVRMLQGIGHSAESASMQDNVQYVCRMLVLFGLLKRRGIDVRTFEVATLKPWVVQVVMLAYPPSSVMASCTDDVLQRVFDAVLEHAVAQLPEKADAKRAA